MTMKTSLINRRAFSYWQPNSTRNHYDHVINGEATSLVRWIVIDELFLKTSLYGKTIKTAINATIFLSNNET